MYVQPQLKRLKRGRQEARSQRSDTDMKNFFSDEEAEEAADRDTYTRRDKRDRTREEDFGSRNRYRREYDDMNDFIADDVEDDLEDVVRSTRKGDEARYEEEHARESRESRRELLEMLPADMDQDALDDMYDIFGDGGDYEYAMFSHQVCQPENDSTHANGQFQNRQTKTVI